MPSESFRVMLLTKRSNSRKAFLCSVLLTVLSGALLTAIQPASGESGGRPLTNDFLDGDLLIAYAPYNETSMWKDPCKIDHHGYGFNYLQTIAQVGGPDWDPQTSCFSGMAFDWEGNLFVLETQTILGTEVGAVAVISGPDSPHEFMYRFDIPAPYYSPISLVFDRTYSFVADRPLWDLYVGCRDDRTYFYGQGPIIKFSHSGDVLAVYPAENEGPNYAASGADWIDLNQTDQETIMYACGWYRIRRYNVTSESQMPDFTVLSDPHAHEVRLLPDGTVLLADEFDIKRLDKYGSEIATYDVPDENCWMRLALDIDGQSFYAGSGCIPTCGDGTGRVYKFDIETGTLLRTIDLECPSGCGAVSGLVVYQTCECIGILDPLVPLDAFGTLRFVDSVQAEIKTAKTLDMENIKAFEVTEISPLAVAGQLEDPVKAGSFTLELETLIPGRGANATRRYYHVNITPHPRADFWPMTGRSPSHTSHSLSTVPQTNQTRWSNTATSAIEYSPAVADGIVFMARNDSITALNETTGAQLWQYAHTVTSSPAVAEGRVFFGSDQGLYALNETTGAYLWRYGYGQVDSSPVISDGKIYFGCSDSRLYIVNATGSLVRSYTANGPIYTSPAVAGGLVYFGSETFMYAVNEASGTLKWMQPRGVRSSPTVAEGAVIFGCSDGLYALNATLGTHYWSYPTIAPVYSSPVVSDGLVFFGCDDHNFYALNATTQAVVWSHDCGDEVRGAPVIAGNGVLKQGCVELRNKFTGELVWQFNDTGPIVASPVLAYGHVFVGYLNGNFHCIGPDHDIAVNLVAGSKTAVGKGYTVVIYVEAENLGGDTESICLSARHGGLIDTHPIVLAPGANATVTFVWYTTRADMGNYTLSADSWPVPGETETADNTLYGGWVFVTIPGDVDGDRQVDIFDIVRMAGVYGIVIAPPRPPRPGDPYNTLNCDIDGDWDIDIFDIVIAAGHYGDSW